MKWNKYSFKTSNDSVDILSALLSDVGIEGIEVEDHRLLTEEDTKGMFIDILPDLGVDDGSSTISFYLDPDNEDTPDILAAAKEVIGDREITESETADADWINNWKEFFKPLSVGNILIKPTWEEIPEEDTDKLLVEIDPGTAFGTGGHETTKLCILALEDALKDCGRDINVLDVGTGSGILGICALRLGAAHVMGTDLDDNAIEAVHENTAQNGITSEQFEVICGNIIDDKDVQDKVGYEKYDIVVANILAPVIIELQKEISRHMKKGAPFITSGIIDMKEQDVLDAFAANKELEVIDVKHMGEWVSVVARKV